MNAPPRRPRLDDVGRLAGVSPATVSLVLREQPGPSADTRRVVLAAAAELGYRPDHSASLLARRRTRLVGVTMDVSSPFHGELLEDLHAEADAKGYDVVVAPLTRVRTEKTTVESLLDRRCEAIVLLGPSLPSADLSELARHAPVVVVGRRDRAPGVSVVRAADNHGVEMAVEHLTGLGHREIAYVDGPPGPIATLRRSGYRVAMRRLHGVAEPIVLPGGATEDDGAAVLLDGSGPKPTAVVVFNDRCAIGVMERARSSGLQVPHDLSVVGFDDSPMARLGTISLTTVNQDPVGLAREAVAAVVARLDAGAAATEVVLAPRLVVRSTTAPPTG